jgi:hypothetical protein
LSPQNIAVITRNVASKQYCLLQVLVAALLLVSCAAFVKKYPDPLNCTKYYLRIDNSFYSLTCPNNLFFDHYKEQCTLEDCKPLNLMWINGTSCSLNMPSYYCDPYNSFTYCTHDGLKIIEKVQCPNGDICLIADTKPCVS